MELRNAIAKEIGNGVIEPRNLIKADRILAIPELMAALALAKEVANGRR